VGIQLLKDQSPFPESRMQGGEPDERIARAAIRKAVGRHLEKMYKGLLEEPLPPNIVDLLRRLD
jgi:hypothetical protein